MTERFETYISELIEDEGGYVNDPADAGGSTIWGLTLRFLRDRVDPSYTIARQKQITQEEAEQIYYDTIWTNPYRTYVEGGMSNLPVGVGETVFNIAVNAGEDDAYECLQRALRDMGYSVGSDQKLGSNLLRQTKRAYAARPLRLLEGIVHMLIEHYDGLVQRGYGRKFKSGWNRRAAGLAVEAGEMHAKAQRDECPECGAGVLDLCQRSPAPDACPRWREYEK